MADNLVNATVEISVSGTPLRLSFDMPDAKVKLRRMLPVFHQISNTFVRLGVENINESGKQISCRAGCGACCRQLVPLSEAEAHQLAELVEAIPEPGRTEIRKRFAAGLEKLNGAGFFEKLDGAAHGSEEQYSDTVDEYFTYQVACPFLENESCSIHESRPIACREYLVTSSPEYCSSAKGEGIENVQHLFKVKEAVIALGVDKLPRELPYVPMIKALEWSEQNSEDTSERESREWMGMFFQELREVSGKS